MNRNFPPHDPLDPPDPLDLLAQARPKPVSPALMARLLRAEPAAAPATVIPLPTAARPPWHRRLLWPALAATAAGIVAALVSVQSPDPANHPTTIATAKPPAAKPAVSVTSSRKWLYARELATGIGDDGQPYRVVEGRWLDCSRIEIAGKPAAWTTVTPGEGIVRTSMPVY